MLTRILLRLCLVAGWATPLCAFALGVGPLEVRSSLNQTFEAEIPLLAGNPVELIGLTVRIPRQQDFDHVGVERLALFSKLRFSVRTPPGGPNVIRITSLEPIRDPNFNLLLELTWPRGRLLREFAVQLDPDLYANRRPPPPPPVVVAPPVAVAAPPVKKPSPAIPALPPAPVVSFEGASFYGPIKPGETLAMVARRVRPSSSTFTVPQTMSILMAGNAEAFTGGNPNTLRAGTTLKVPNPQAMGVPTAAPPTPIPDLAAASPPAPIPPSVAEPVPTAPPPAVSPPVTVEPPPPAVAATPPVSPTPTGTSPAPPLPALSSAERPQEIIPQASIPQPVALPPVPEPAPPVAVPAQPAPPPVVKPSQPAPPPVVKPSAPVAADEPSWTDNPVVWVAIALIVLAVGAVVLLPLLRRPARRPKPTVESESAIVSDASEGTQPATPKTQTRDPRSARSQPLSETVAAAAAAALRGVEAAPQSSRVSLGKEASGAGALSKPIVTPASKPIVTPMPKPVGEPLKDMDFGLNMDQTVVAGGKSAARDIKAPTFDAEPPTASVITRRPVDPFPAAPPTEPGIRPSQPSQPQIEELPSELRLDGLDFDFGDLGLEHTARPQPAELPPLELNRTPNARSVDLPQLDLLSEPKTLAPPPDKPKPAPVKPAMEDLKFEFSDVRSEHDKAASDEPLRLDMELQDFGGDNMPALGKMAVEPSAGGRAEASTDYIETKLDLATAYLDMGDQVGARNLLDEVLKEGDAAQKQRAGELRKKLG